MGRPLMMQKNQYKRRQQGKMWCACVCVRVPAASMCVRVGVSASACVFLRVRARACAGSSMYVRCLCVRACCIDVYACASACVCLRQPACACVCLCVVVAKLCATPGLWRAPPLSSSQGFRIHVCERVKAAYFYDLTNGEIDVDLIHSEYVNFYLPMRMFPL